MAKSSVSGSKLEETKIMKTRRKISQPGFKTFKNDV